MPHFCLAIAMIASMVMTSPVEGKPTAIDENGALMPAIGMPPPSGTRMLGMSITPDNPDAPIIYRVGSTLDADAFLKAYARAAADAGLRVSQVRGNRIIGTLKNGADFSLDVSALEIGSGSTGVLTIGPDRRQ